MKSNGLFYFGVAVDALLLLTTLSDAFLSGSAINSSDGTVYGTSDGLTAFGKIMVWLIPLGVLAVLAGGFWLRSAGKNLAANVLVWLPALPMLAGIVFWGGLALLFILFGK